MHKLLTRSLNRVVQGLGQSKSLNELSFYRHSVAPRKSDIQVCLGDIRFIAGIRLEKNEEFELFSA
jgi:hypothetical protein